MTLNEGISKIEINKRFIRRKNVLGIKQGDRNVILFPIKDIVTDNTFYYLYQGYNSVIVYGPELENEMIGHENSELFTLEHNKFMFKNILKCQRNLSDSLNKRHAGKFESYYVIGGLIVYKNAIEEIRDNLIF